MSEYQDWGLVYKAMNEDNLLKDHPDGLDKHIKCIKISSIAKNKNVLRDFSTDVNHRFIYTILLIDSKDNKYHVLFESDLTEHYGLDRLNRENNVSDLVEPILKLKHFVEETIRYLREKHNIDIFTYGPIVNAPRKRTYVEVINKGNHISISCIEPDKYKEYPFEMCFKLDNETYVVQFEEGSGFNLTDALRALKKNNPTLKNNLLYGLF